MRYAIFVFMLAAIVVAATYVIFRLWHMIPAASPLRWVALALGIVATGSLFAGILAGDALPGWLATATYRLGTSWLFIMLYLLMLFVVGDLLRFVGVPVGRFMLQSWTALGAVTLLMAVVFSAGYLNYTVKKRVALTIATPHLQPSARPVRIVAASDLHLGYGIGRGELARWVDMINAEDPDIVVFAGDLIDNSVKEIRRGGFAHEFARLRAPGGVFACPGNHEYISGIATSVEVLTEGGITVLRDSAAVAAGVRIVGRDDRTNRARASLRELTAARGHGSRHELAPCGDSSHQPSPASGPGSDDASAALPGSDEASPASEQSCLPSILLDHQPYDLDEAAASGFDLQISGHTHRGQVWPFSWITDRMFELSHGMVRRGPTTIYVTSGLGIWGGKFRIGTRSEYVVIDLVPAGSGMPSAGK